MTGCCNVYISEPGSLSGIDIKGATTPGDRAVVLTNSGVYLFWNITLGSGDLRWDEKKQDIKGGIAFFKDLSGVEDLYELLTQIAARENCDIACVYGMNRSDSDLECFSYQGAAMGLVGCNNVVLSAVLRPKKQEAEK